MIARRTGRRRGTRHNTTTLVGNFDRILIADNLLAVTVSMVAAFRIC
jgi:hypothetical protein